MQRNPVGWFEIYVEDMPRAKAFYEAVLRVEFTRLPAPEIEMQAFPMNPDLPGSPGALVKMEGVPAGAGGTLIYFSCEDCGEEASRVEAAGGKVFKPKFDIGEYGFIALASDTEGNLFGLHSLK